MRHPRPLSLIGFPGSGKSTVGVLLAKRLGISFVGTDILIQTQEQATLAEIIARRDHHLLREIEEQVLLDIAIKDSVISTGGSVVYSDRIMERLSRDTLVIYLRAQLSTVEYRISLAPDRGIASAKDQTLADIFNERIPLYQRWAQLSLDVDTDPPETLVDTLIKQLDAQLP